VVVSSQTVTLKVVSLIFLIVMGMEVSVNWFG
jgi:hypothetical protein